MESLQVPIYESLENVSEQTTSAVAADEDWFLIADQFPQNRVLPAQLYQSSSSHGGSTPVRERKKQQKPAAAHSDFQSSASGVGSIGPDSPPGSPPTAAHPSVRVFGIHDLLQVTWARCFWHVDRSDSMTHDEDVYMDSHTNTTMPTSQGL